MAKPPSGQDNTRAVVALSYISVLVRFSFPILISQFVTIEA